MRVRERLSTPYRPINLRRRTRNSRAIVTFQSLVSAFQLATVGQFIYNCRGLILLGWGSLICRSSWLFSFFGAQAEEPIQENINNEEDCIDSARRRVPCFHVSG